MNREDLIKLVTEEVIKELQKISFPGSSTCDSKNPASSSITGSNKILFNNKLLTEKSLQNLLTENIKIIEIKKGTIITPSAKDALTDRGIKISYT